MSLADKIGLAVCIINLLFSAIWMWLLFGQRIKAAIPCEKLPRWANHWYARIFGYFWIPCPICGERFGGHERERGNCASIQVRHVLPETHEGANGIRYVSSDVSLEPGESAEGYPDGSIMVSRAVCAKCGKQIEAERARHGLQITHSE